MSSPWYVGLEYATERLEVISKVLVFVHGHSAMQWVMGDPARRSRHKVDDMRRRLPSAYAEGDTQSRLARERRASSAPRMARSSHERPYPWLCQHVSHDPDSFKAGGLYDGYSRPFTCPECKRHT